MPPKRRQLPKDSFCKSCRKFFTAKSIGKHVLYCTKWDLQEQQEDPEPFQLVNSDAEHELTDEFSLSSDDSSSGDDPNPLPHPVMDEPLPVFDDFPAEEPMELDQTIDEAIQYQNERVYDEIDDEDWWNEYCVPEPEGFVEEIEQDGEEFEEILNWIDKEFDLEVAQNIRSFLTPEDKQNIKMFAIRYRHNITNLLHQHLREQFQNEIAILTSFTLHKRVLKLAGWKPTQYDRCINSCIAYTGPFEKLESCPHCHIPRRDENGKTSPYYTLPLAPQLTVLYASLGTTREAMNHTAQMLESFDASKIRDIHDANVVQSLLGKRVVVNGQQQQHTYFGDKRDVPLGMMTDGFQCFKRARRGKSSAWPVILINYGRPVTERMRIENIIPFALIPGPNQPKDFNSFLFPLKTELDALAIGIQAYDSIPDKLFQLHAYLVVAIGDMQAVKHFSCMKGPGAVRPCRLCNIKGIWSRARRKYYVPLRPPDDNDQPLQARFTLESLPLRTAPQILQQLQQLRDEPRVTYRDELSKKFGINGESVLNSIAGFNRISGYPHEYMHLLFENIIPMLVCLWKGDYRDVDNSEQPYVISAENWAAIGCLTAESNRSTPSSFSRLIPNIDTDQNLFTAEAYAFWFVHMAPSLLRGRFAEERYYKHAMSLVKIVEKCLQFEITREEIDILEYNIGIWVTKFERYYYQYDMRRLQVCTLPVHALLHVPQDIRASGPVSVCWSWVMERFCGLLGIVARKGRRHPNAVITSRMHQHALVLFFDAQYDLGLRRLFRAGRTREASDEDTADPGLIQGTDLRLSVPTPKGFIPDQATRRQIAKFFPILVTGRRRDHIRIKDFEEILPVSMNRWNKLQILNGGDQIRCLDTDSEISTLGKRDNSFVRYTLFPDRNQLDPAQRDEPISQVQYGRLRYIVVFEMPLLEGAGNEFAQPKTYRLACIQPCRILDPGDATLQLIEMKEMQDTPIFVQVGVVECSVGRVRTRGGWSIIDRSSEWARTVFIPEDVEDDEDDL